MIDQELIVEVHERPAPELDDERRQYYRITKFGEAVARAETRRLQELVRLARASGVRRPQQAVRAGSGGRSRSGCACRHWYVVNEDDRGESYLLFALPGQAAANPPRTRHSRASAASGGAAPNPRTRFHV